jgi:hypothetical protein
MCPEARPFENSLEALAQVGLRATGARSYRLLRKNGSAGAMTPPGAVTPTVVEYPLRTNGVLTASVAFEFDNQAEALRARPRLDRIAASIQEIWTAASTNRYADLVDRVSVLEARLMDSKIADRALGLLANEANSDPTEAIARHVDGVLRSAGTRLFLKQVLEELEDEIEERGLVAQAKRILQSLYRFSEEQAHHHLRVLSRKSRKPLKDVAQQVIEDLQLLKGKSA